MLELARGLRDFVATHLGANYSFVKTENTLIFEHLQPVSPVRRPQ